MKKVMRIAVVVMILAAMSSVTVFAAGGVLSSTAVDGDNRPATVKLDVSPMVGAEDEISANMKNILGDKYEEGLEVLDVKLISRDSEAPTFPVSVTFEVSYDIPIKYVLLYDSFDKGWDDITTSSTNNSITAKFMSMDNLGEFDNRGSNIAFIGVAPEEPAPTAPQTSDSTLPFMYSLLAIIATGGIVIVTTKKRKRA